MGRWFASGSTESHTLRLVVAATKADVPGGTVTVSAAGAAADEFHYAALPAPVTLAASTVYYLLSEEVAGGDGWYDQTTALTGSGAAAISFGNLFVGRHAKYVQ